MPKKKKQTSLQRAKKIVPNKMRVRDQLDRSLTKFKWSNRYTSTYNQMAKTQKGLANLSARIKQEKGDTKQVSRRNKIGKKVGEMREFYTKGEVEGLKSYIKSRNKRKKK